MTVLETVLIVVLALVASALIAAVMMQQGRGAEIGAAFGSGSANTIFGSAGIASPLARLTWGLATAFFALSLTLAFLAKQRATATDDLLPATAQTAPAPARPASDVPQVPTQVPMQVPMQAPTQVPTRAPVGPPATAGGAGSPLKTPD